MKPPTNYTISVVITCFREGKLIHEAVNSIKEQTLRPDEIIIVNDKSSDLDTNSVCHDLENEPDITLIWRTENGGPSVARNNGYEVATGEILVPLDADDLLPPNALQLIHNTFVAHPLIGFVYGHYLRYDRADKPPKLIKPSDISLNRTLKARKLSVGTNWQLLGSGPIRKSLWQSLEGYDDQFGVNDLHDLEFWLRALAKNTTYAYIPESIYIWRKYLGSNTQKVTPMSWYRIAKIYFDVYQSVGLKYRAIELMLLGAKWQNNHEEIKQYSKQLIQCILQGQFQFSSLMILLTPPSIIQLILKRGIVKR